MFAAFVLSTVLLAAPQTVDGDTVRARGETYRLANIDAPETGPRAECAAERALGRRSTARVRQLIGDASRVEARLVGRRDRYGREVAHIVIDGKDLGRVLISEGLAQPWRGRKAAWC